MDEVLSAAEFWLLSHLIDLRMPVGVFGSTNIAELLSGNPPRFGPTRMLQAIRSLNDRRLIATGRRTRAAGLVETPAIENLESSLAERRPYTTYMWLTAEGGAAWEGYAQPDWRKFLLEDRDEHGRVTAVTSQHDRMIAWYCEALRGAVAGGVLGESREPVESWRATYWKTLVGGTRFTFQWSTDGGCPDVRSAGHRAMQYLTRLWRCVGS
jgi:hypothetical protein